ncbi:MFS transporter [Actimicrobium antarcticum]|uniref:MFS transporter n=1 Tax=Actimicrobium antarcticum TaxID=1051899 RepID=A0ABP7TXY2_9BURK
MQSTAVPAPARTLLSEQVALPILFILLGSLFATWAARIPALRDALQLNAAEVGLVLLCSGIGAVLSFPLASWLVSRHGARRAALWSGMLALALVPCLALAPRQGWLMLAMFGMGAGASCFDVAINAIGAEVERAAGRSIMSLLHAWFCLGTFGGALLGSAMAGLQVTPLLHFSVLCGAFALPLWLSYRALPADRIDPDQERKHFMLPHGALVTLGLIAFCGAMIEGSIGDWSGIYLTDHLGAAAGVAPLGFAVFSGVMLLARLVGDPLKDRFGARPILVVGAAIATAGVVLVIAAPQLALAFAGFALLGVGVAAVFPFIFSAAGKEGPNALAGVATMGYSGGLIGPPVIGFLAHGMGLQVALGFIGVLTLMVMLAAGKARLLD